MACGGKRVSKAAVQAKAKSAQFDTPPQGPVNRAKFTCSGRSGAATSKQFPAARFRKKTPNAPGPCLGAFLRPKGVTRFSQKTEKARARARGFLRNLSGTVGVGGMGGGSWRWFSFRKQKSTRAQSTRAQEHQSTKHRTHRKHRKHGKHENTESTEHARIEKEPRKQDIRIGPCWFGSCWRR